MGVARGAKEKGKGTHKHTHKHKHAKHDALGSNAIALLAVTLLFTVILLYILHVPKPPPQVTVTIKPPEWKWTSPLTVVPTVGVIALVVYAFVKLWLNRRGAHGSELNGQMVQVIRALTGTFKETLVEQNNIHVEGLELAAAERDKERVDRAQEAAAATASREADRAERHQLQMELVAGLQQGTKNWRNAQAGCCPAGSMNMQTRLAGVTDADGLMQAVSDLLAHAKSLEGQIHESERGHKVGIKGIIDSLESMKAKAPTNNEGGVRDDIAALRAHVDSMTATMNATVAALGASNNNRIDVMFARMEQMQAGASAEASESVELMRNALLSNMTRGNDEAVASSRETLQMLQVATDALTASNIANNERLAAALGEDGIRGALATVSKAVKNLASFTQGQGESAAAQFGNGLATAADVTRFVENVRGLCEGGCDDATQQLIRDIEDSVSARGADGNSPPMPDAVLMRIKYALNADMQRINKSQEGLVQSANDAVAFLTQEIGGNGGPGPGGGNLHEMTTLYLMQRAAILGLMSGTADVEAMREAHQSDVIAMNAVSRAAAAGAKARINEISQQLAGFKAAVAHSIEVQVGMEKREQVLKGELRSLQDANTVQVDAASEEASDASVRIAALQDQLEDSIAERRAMKQRETDLLVQSMQQQAAQAKLQEDYDAADKDADELGYENATLFTQVEKLEGDMIKRADMHAQELNDMRTASNEAASVAASTARKDIETVQQQVVRFRTMAFNAQEAKGQVDAQVNALEVEAHRLRANIQRNVGDARIQGAQIETLNKQLAKTEGMRVRLAQEVAGHSLAADKHATDLAAMQSNLATSEAGKATLLTEVENLRRTLEQSTKENNAKRAESEGAILAVERQLFGVKTRLQRAVEERAQKEVRERELAAQSLQLQEQIIRQTGETTQNREQIESLQTKLDAATTASTESAREQARMQESERTLMANASQHEKTLEGLQAEKDELTKIDGRLRVKMAKLEVEYRDIYDANAKLEEDKTYLNIYMKDAAKTHTRLLKEEESKGQTLQARVEAIIKEKGKAKEEARILTLKVKSLQDTAVERDRDLKGQYGLVDALSDEKAFVLERNAALKQKERELKAEVAQHNDVLARLKETHASNIAVLRSALAEGTARNNELERTLEEEKVQVQGYVERIAVLEGEIKRLTDIAAQSAQLTGELKGENEQLQGERRDLTGAVHKLFSDLKSLRSEKNDLEVIVEEMEYSILRGTLENEKLKRTLQEVEAQVSVLQSDLSQKNAKNEEQRRELIAADKRREEGEEQIRNRVAELDRHPVVSTTVEGQQFRDFFSAQQPSAVRRSTSPPKGQLIREKTDVIEQKLAEAAGEGAGAQNRLIPIPGFIQRSREKQEKARAAAAAKAEAERLRDFSSFSDD
jgi:chromosome segregation ATPase